MSLEYEAVNKKMKGMKINQRRKKLWKKRGC